jgi:hypothetical protein
MTTYHHRLIKLDFQTNANFIKNSRDIAILVTIRTVFWRDKKRLYLLFLKRKTNAQVVERRIGRRSEARREIIGRRPLSWQSLATP